MILFTFALYVASAQALPNDIGIEWVKAGPAVVAEYCKTERDPSTSCTAPNGDVALISLPTELNRVVNLHIGRAYESRFFDELSRLDFFHGHFILSGKKAERVVRTDGKKAVRYAAASEFFADAGAVLYHSAEYTYRWQRGDYRPRSFVGWTDLDDPRIQPAIDLINPQKISNNYRNAGTIQPDELVKSRPELSDLAGEKIEMELCRDRRCRVCQTDSMLVILPAQGRSPVDAHVYLRCAFPPADGSELKFSLQPNPQVLLN